MKKLIFFPDKKANLNVEIPILGFVQGGNKKDNISKILLGSTFSVFSWRFERTPINIDECEDLLVLLTEK